MLSLLARLRQEVNQSAVGLKHLLSGRDNAKAAKVTNCKCGFECKFPFQMMFLLSWLQKYGKQSGVNSGLLMWLENVAPGQIKIRRF